MTPATLGSLAPADQAVAAPVPSSVPRTATVAWRVGRGSMLEVALGWSDCRIEAEPGVVAATVLIRSNAAELTAPRDAQATAEIESLGAAGEVGFRIDLGGDRGLAILRLVAVGRERPVVVTDLPERLGLRGGTYTIERVEA